MSAPSAGRPVVVMLVQNLAVPFDRRVWQEALALREAGYDVKVICPRSVEHPMRRETLEGIDIYRYRPWIEARRAAGYLAEYAVALLSMAALSIALRTRRRISVVHICNPPDLLFVVAWPLKLLGARVVFDQHDAGPELVLAKGHCPGGAFERVARIIERLNFSVADVVIATNDSYRHIAETRGRMDPRRVFVVRSGPNAERFAGAQPDRSWRMGKSYLVGYVGVMGMQDGLGHLIDAAEIIVRKHARTDVAFVCVGAGPELNLLRRRVSELGLDEWVHFPGRLSDVDLGPILATSDVCVNPDVVNRMNDISTMNKIMEYMALGKPIVQFDLLEGRISAGESSLYAAANDASSFATCILQLLDDSVLRESMGALGKGRLKKGLDWEHQIPQLIRAYERATANPPRAHA